MSSADVTRVLRNGGQLCINPTDLSTAWPHGGTGLGVVGDVVLKQHWVTDEAMGADDRHANESIETYYLGESWVMAFTVRQWDNDPLDVFFPNRINGATRRVLADQYSGVAATRRPGTKLSTSGFKLLFTPNDYLTSPAVIFYKAVPILEAMQEIQLSAMEEMKVAVVVRAMYHNTIGKLHKMGLLSELSLT